MILFSGIPLRISRRWGRGSVAGGHGPSAHPERTKMATARSTAILAVASRSMGILPMNTHGRDARATTARIFGAGGNGAGPCV